MKIAVGQINSTIGDFDGNADKILEYSHRAAADGMELILFPEMSLCGYPPMDLLDYQSFVSENQRALRRLQRDLPRDVAVAVGYVERTTEGCGKALQNVVSVLLDGRILHSQAKTLLPTYDVFDEDRYFEPARSQEVFEYRGKRIGIAICEDIWWQSDALPGFRYAQNPVKTLLDQGAELLLAPSASPYYAGKQEIRLGLLRKIASSSGVPTVYANMVGGNDNLVFDGYSMITDRSGALIAHGLSFSEDYITVELPNQEERPSIRLPETDELESLRQALVLGLRDYVRKCGFKKVHLGLSGGIDSALVAVLAAQALGSENVRSFALPTAYSSPESERDARHLAENLGIGFDVLPVEKDFRAVLESLEPIFDGTDAGLAEENIQARLRGLLLMAYSNKFDSLLLTTGNKSELAVGYCTLYGDMAGGLSVIGDLFKGQVYALCRYINREREVIPENILTRPPSAELRPNQTDQDSLPDYGVLDGILELYLLRNKTAEQIIEQGYDDGTVREVLHLVGRNEYKRRQAPPVLKVSSRAFGTGRRMPLSLIHI